ncbi:hypothetical protein KSS87_010383 [Heliosperma pusillum]|nr:hypothetical protein KSS87_010383 [Heliosperma pusillum]
MAIEVKCCETDFFVNIGVIVFLVIFAGLMSGLTLGLMSLSLVDLEVLAKSGTPKDRKHAEKIMPVVKNQHLLLCTLLICNAAAMEALPIFLDSLVTAWGAILISVTLILLFGEIIPQSICSRYGLAIGAAVAPFVRVLVWVCSPVAYPISKLLDLLLGHGRVALFRRAELKTLVNLHGNEVRNSMAVEDNVAYMRKATSDCDSTSSGEPAGESIEALRTQVMTSYPTVWLSEVSIGQQICKSRRLVLMAGKGGELTHDETTIIAGALELTEKTAGDAMTPISETFSIDINAKLDRVMMNLVLDNGHSRVPVYYEEYTNIIGCILVKNLLTIHPEDEVPVKSVTIRKIPRLPVTMPLYDILNEFQKGHSHIAVVIRQLNKTEIQHANGGPADGSPVREVTVVIDNDNEDQEQQTNQKEKSGKQKRNMYKWKSYPHSNKSNKGSRAKKWNKNIYSNILEIDQNPLPKPDEEEAVGIITLEDVIEELLQEEIYDETDHHFEDS